MFITFTLLESLENPRKIPNDRAVGSHETPLLRATRGSYMILILRRIILDERTDLH